MKKKILIVSGVVLALLASLVAWELLVGTKRSPQATAAHAATGTQVSYCRPYKKDRVIFGDATSGALVPHDKYWRLGANAATEITFAKTTSFAGKEVAAGTYRMYAVPGAQSWKVVLNSETGWGAREPDHGKDLASVEVPVEHVATAVEQFTIAFADEADGTKMDFSWDTTRVRVPLATL